MPDFDSITDEEWIEYSDRLTLHAVRQFWKHGWKSQKGAWAGPGGMTPDDVAQETICRVLEGRRQFSIGAYPSFLDFLRHAANSLISHLAEQERAKGTISLSNWSPAEDSPPRDAQYASKARDPCEECLSEERRERIKAVVFRHFADDPVVMQIVDCLNGGITERADIAEYLGIDPKEVDNARKRLCRGMKKELDL